jgi:hypothetical protein
MQTTAITIRPKQAASSELARTFEQTGISPSALRFAAILLFVGAVSVYDGYLVIRTGDMIGEFEKNPVGLRLIEFNHGDPTLFLIAKGIGTCVALVTMVVLYRRWRRIAVPVAYALLVFQAGLLLYLECG